MEATTTSFLFFIDNINCFAIEAGTKLDIKGLHKSFVMGCPNNMAEWQVAYWTKMSHQRTLFECEKHIKENTEYNGTLLGDNVDKNRWENKTTFRKDHEEDLNPWTKVWRESLRTWNYRYMALPTASVTETPKKKVSFTKK